MGSFDRFEKKPKKSLSEMSFTEIFKSAAISSVYFLLIIVAMGLICTKAVEKFENSGDTKSTTMEEKN